MTRRDPLVQWLALLNRAVFWFHPLAWWLERHLGSLAEEACDDSVLAHGHSPADYSQQLLDIARAAGRRPALPLVGMAMSGSALPKRIAKILDGGTHPPASRAAVAGAGALATLAAAVLGTVTLAQEPARPRSLLEIYELALANDPVVRQAEAEYRALTAARPQAPNAVAAATADYDAARQELLIRVAVPYFGAVTAGRELARKQTMQEALARQLEQAQRRFEVGLTAVTDVQETQANFDRVAASELSAQNELAAARQALRDVVGEPVGELKPLGEDFSLSSPTPSDADQWVATALQRNPALIAARIRAENADGDPARRAAIAGLERVTVQTEQATRSAYLGLVAAIARARALEQSVRSSQTMLRATRVAFDTGTRSSRDVVTADSALRASEAEYVSSVYDYALNMLRLQRAAGGLTEQKIAELSDWF